MSLLKSEGREKLPDGFQHIRFEKHFLGTSEHNFWVVKGNESRAPDQKVSAYNPRTLRTERVRVFHPHTGPEPDSSAYQRNDPENVLWPLWASEPIFLFHKTWIKKNMENTGMVSGTHLTAMAISSRARWNHLRGPTLHHAVQSK